MVDCTLKSDGKKEILPIFFNVEPDDVKLRTKLYRDALSEHEKRYSSHEVKRWGEALVEVPTRVGWKLEGQGYGELIESIVREVQLKLKVKSRSLPDHLVKMDDEEAIEELLDFDFDDVRFVIIHGTGGIGKSTLAKVIFNRFLFKFNYSSFLEDIQDLSQRHGLLHVQRKLLSDTLGSNSVDGIHDTNDGINRIRKGLSNKKVMVVVDNVTEKQLENLVGSDIWFGSGSRIIITVRDRRTIIDRTMSDEYNQMGSSYYMDYPMKEMSLDRAIQLFSKHAFRNDAPPKDWHNFSTEVVSSIGRLPLTLEVVGSLFARTINEDNKFWMHDELKALGRYIVKEESFEDAGKRRWVWIDENMLDILRSSEEKRRVRALSLGISHDLTPEELAPRAKKLKIIDLTRCKMLTKTPDFSEFGKLKKLILADCVNLSAIDSSIGKLKLLSTLNIAGCDSLEGLPKEIGSLECLMEIIMPSSSEPFKFPKTLGNLRSLMKFEIRSHEGISQLPHSIGRLTNLTHLLLIGCKYLHELLDIIEELESLVELDLRESGIYVLPNSIGNMKRLKIMRLACTKIQMIPCALGGVETLEVLDASFCWSLKHAIPWEMWSLTRLKILDLEWSPIPTVPPRINGFSSLQTLKIGSNQLSQLPELPSSLKYLCVRTAKFPFLPDLSNLLRLELLYVRSKHPSNSSWSADEIISPWEDAQSINRLPRSLSSLTLSWIPQLPDFSDFKNLSFLSIEGCPMPHFPVLKYLERLGELMILSCIFLESTPNLSCLKRLRELHLTDLHKMAEITGLGELESLKVLKISRCDIIEQLPSLSKLKNLADLELDYCGKMRDVKGLKELNLLKHVKIKQCMSLKSLPDMPSLTKLKTDWMPAKRSFRVLWNK
ncbi:disease resistance protein RPV1-like [Eucalyptus grandis]|uniref:disease resistance protein RPV1-like n=1 Tax=Eucalyptus grandis TaxID=71139 RepID=UPI00192E8776|nr:disease resistance protein RPV1-like [Eucalyptus grandis]